jgi:uncharacterized protein (DUF1919 family)
MYKIVLFGAASGSDKVIKMLNLSKCNIIAYIDNDSLKYGSKRNNIEIHSPFKLLELQFDYIILTNQHYKYMKNQLIDMGIDNKCIIEKPSQLYKYEFNNFKKTDTKFSIISDDCFGGYVYNMLGIKYSSPFIWTLIENKDYIKFLENYKYYMNKKLIFIDSKYNYPIAKLGDIIIKFIHCEDENEAKNGWNKRSKRICNNLYIKMTCDDEKIIKRFDELPFNNKVCFTYHCYNQYRSCVWLKDIQNVNPMCRNNGLTIFYKYFDVYKWIK